jgi:hypothetical protein
MRAFVSPKTDKRAGNALYFVSEKLSWRLGRSPATLKRVKLGALRMAFWALNVRLMRSRMWKSESPWCDSSAFRHVSSFGPMSS